MEQLRTEETVTTIKYHDFYCDDCQCLVGTSVEYPDGGYELIGAYELNVLTPDGIFKYYNKCMCDDCKAKFPSTVSSALEAIGFARTDEI
jgi:hypothetical protein